MDSNDNSTKSKAASNITTAVHSFVHSVKQDPKKGAGKQKKKKKIVVPALARAAKLREKQAREKAAKAANKAKRHAAKPSDQERFLPKNRVITQITISGMKVPQTA